jgi:uncharacterized membrane protein YdjX (TVP38/TMEM64 family)
MNARRFWVTALTIFVAALLAVLWRSSDWLPHAVAWLRGAGLVGIGVFTLVYTLSVLVAVPVVWMAALGGWLWGAAIGAAIAWPASLAGSTLTFLIARRILAGMAARLLARSPRLAAVDEALGEGGAGIVALLRLCTPNNFLNFGLAASRVHTHDFVLGSAFGLAPLVIMFAVGGGLAGDLAGVFRASERLGAWRLVLTGVGGAAALLAFWLIARAARRALERRTR